MKGEHRRRLRGNPAALSEGAHADVLCPVDPERSGRSLYGIKLGAVEPDGDRNEPVRALGFLGRSPLHVRP